VLVLPAASAAMASELVVSTTGVFTVCLVMVLPNECCVLQRVEKIYRRNVN